MPYICIDELELIEKAAQKSSNLICEISAHLHMPNFKEIENMDQSKHILLYFCDLWSWISAHIKDENVKEFSSFLLLSRRFSCSIIFEFHGNNKGPYANT